MDTPELRPRRRPTLSRDPQDETAADHAKVRTRAAAVASTLGNQRVGRVLRSADRQAELDESVAREIDSRRGGGRPLQSGVREEMEGAFGHDFSDVRVHTDGDADRFNEEVAARAFTVGNDVFFKQGAYAPSSRDGRGLLAHELTHVVQQEGASGAPTTVSDPSDASERQADAVAQEIVSAAGTEVGSRGVARQPEEEDEDLQMARQAPAKELEEEQVMAARQAPEEVDEGSLG